MMKLLFLALASLLVVNSASGATYSYTGDVFDLLTDYTSCTTGSCANFSPGDRVTGTITTLAPLAPNLSSVDITAQISAYSFSDGIETFSSTDPKVRLFSPFVVTTDGAGAISTLYFQIERWQVSGASHVTGDRADRLYSVVPPTSVGSDHNIQCDGTGVSSAGVPDSCTSIQYDSATSHAHVYTLGYWIMSVLPASVPTLHESALILLALLLSAGASVAIRRVH